MNTALWGMGKHTHAHTHTHTHTHTEYPETFFLPLVPDRGSPSTA